MHIIGPDYKLAIIAGMLAALSYYLGYYVAKAGLREEHNRQLVQLIKETRNAP